MKIVANTESVEISLDDKEIKDLGKDQAKYKPAFDAIKKMQSDYIAAKVEAQRSLNESLIEKTAEANKQAFEYQMKVQKKANRSKTIRNIVTNTVRVGVGAGIIYTILNKDTLKAKFFGKKK